MTEQKECKHLNKIKSKLDKLMKEIEKNKDYQKLLQDKAYRKGRKEAITSLKQELEKDLDDAYDETKQIVGEKEKMTRAIRRNVIEAIKYRQNRIFKKRRIP